MRAAVTKVFLTFILAAGLLWAFRRSGTGVPMERIGIPADGRLEKSDALWRQLLTAEQFWITRERGTESPFSGEYWHTKKDGIYHCVCCGQALFDAGEVRLRHWLAQLLGTG